MFYKLLAGAVATACVVYQVFFADNQDDRGGSKPGPTSSYEPPQPQVRRREERLPQSQTSYEPAQPAVRQRNERQPSPIIDPSQRDDAVSPLEVYASLRNRAKQEGDLMSKYFKESKAAYERRDRALASTLSDKGKQHKKKMDDLNAKASALIFKENNQDKGSDEVDLHNLYVKEAVVYAEKALARARREGLLEIQFIVGQGNHSDGGVARIKPAIQDAMQGLGLRVAVDPRNPGVLVVPLGGR